MHTVLIAIWPLDSSPSQIIYNYIDSQLLFFFTTIGWVVFGLPLNRTPRIGQKKGGRAVSGNRVERTSIRQDFVSVTGSSINMGVPICENGMRIGNQKEIETISIS